MLHVGGNGGQSWQLSSLLPLPPYREKASTTHWFMCPAPGH